MLLLKGTKGTAAKHQPKAQGQRAKGAHRRSGRGRQCRQLRRGRPLEQPGRQRRHGEGLAVAPGDEASPVGQLLLERLRQAAGSRRGGNVRREEPGRRRRTEGERPARAPRLAAARCPTVLMLAAPGEGDLKAWRSTASPCCTDRYRDISGCRVTSRLRAGVGRAGQGSVIGWRALAGLAAALLLLLQGTGRGLLARTSSARRAGAGRRPGA
jgi:hypothetical protein